MCQGYRQLLWVVQTGGPPTRPRRGPRARPGAEELRLGRGHGVHGALPNANAHSTVRQSPDLLPDLRGPPPWPEPSLFHDAVDARKRIAFRRERWPRWWPRPPLRDASGPWVRDIPGGTLSLPRAGKWWPRPTGTIANHSSPSHRLPGVTQDPNAADVPPMCDDRLVTQVLRGQDGRRRQRYPNGRGAGTRFALTPGGRGPRCGRGPPSPDSRCSRRDRWRRSGRGAAR